MAYMVVVNREVADRIADWEYVSPLLRSLLYNRIERELGEGEPNGGIINGLNGCLRHRIRLADPSPDSDALFNFVLAVQTVGNRRRVVDANYLRTGGPRGLVL